MGDASETDQLLQFTGLAILGSGKRSRSSWPVADLLPTSVESGRLGTFSQPPMARPFPARTSEKSPAFSATVGTLALRAAPRSSRFHSSEKKKNHLSFLIGPPMSYPKSLRRSLSFLMPFWL